ncbi:hypothetical protein [Vulcaniibacterium tengchongense]|uniref:Cytochrome c556 n=1 Tax=Vulcaniibacterium tengchongense TaxID=1273429 RepID=A0A3N4VJB9_9GAMM|nr:hypothetical protein [Vulcaniibacterium tengchongense]RPE81793.1 hypothetical protein EDC50_0995 [Vulcaniibacterium tengchongense]
MSDTQPARSGNASKYLFLFLLGLVVGAVATVMAMRAIQARQDHFHEGVMHVQQWHFDRLRQKVEQNRCAATDVLPDLRTLRLMADDIEAAFPDLRDDPRFVGHASRMRATLDDALANPPLNCAAVGTLAGTIGESCKGCHQDYR